MSQFEELIREWDEMMCIEFDAAPLQVHGITFVQEQRILERTAQYIRKLEAIQIESDRRGTDFADRLFRSVRIDNQLHDKVREICQRFLSSVGMIFRDEIPRDLPRSERLSAGRFIIDWSNGNVVGRWPELQIHFQLRDSLAYCVEHIAGADEKLGEAIVSQYVSELQTGTVQIPRLTLISTDASSLTFQWEDASVSPENPTAISACVVPTKSKNVQFESASPILTYFRSRIEDSQRRLESAMMSKPEPENPNVLALRVIDQIDLAEADPIREQVKTWIASVGNYSGLSEHQLVQKFEEVAYAEASEAIVLELSHAVEKRSKVVKSLNALRRKQERQLVLN